MLTCNKQKIAFLIPTVLINLSLPTTFTKLKHFWLKEVRSLKDFYRVVIEKWKEYQSQQLTQRSCVKSRIEKKHTCKSYLLNFLELKMQTSFILRLICCRQVRKESKLLKRGFTNLKQDTLLKKTMLSNLIRNLKKLSQNLKSCAT